MNNIIDLINSAVKNTELLLNSQNNMDESEKKKVMQSIISGLMEIKTKTSELITENSDQKNEIIRLKALACEEKEFFEKNGVYFSCDGDGPFCPFCYDRRSKKIRLRSETSDKDSTVTYACRVCGNSYN